MKEQLKKDYDLFVEKLNQKAFEDNFNRGNEIISFQLYGFSNDLVAKFLRKYKRDKERFCSMRMTVEQSRVLKA